MIEIIFILITAYRKSEKPNGKKPFFLFRGTKSNKAYGLELI